ncbi:hypothetical protein BDL97_01G039300 [Sphagnum fallax]|nr:hypothetical protein BDL97_01G039300 [Sphagnum fallax]
MEKEKESSRLSWPWKKKSSNKAAAAAVTTSLASAGGVGGASPNLASLFQDNNQQETSVKKLQNHTRAAAADEATRLRQSEEKVKYISEQLANALADITAKDNLVKQHAKVAEEAVSGWEKAELEAMALKQQLDTALHQKLVMEDRAAHLDGALKECMKQLRHAHEEHEQLMHDTLVKKTREYDKLRVEMETKLAEASHLLSQTRTELLESRAEGKALSHALQERSRSLAELGEAKGRAEADIKVLQCALTKTSHATTVVAQDNAQSYTERATVATQDKARSYTEQVSGGDFIPFVEGRLEESAGSPGSQVPMCQVEGCNADLSTAKHYHRRHNVCEFHSKARNVVAHGHVQRFCQQCSRFHVLSEFDDGKRSCRRRLAYHDALWHKPMPSALTCDAAVECIGMKGEEDSDLSGSPASDEQPASAKNNLQLSTPAATFGRVPKEDQHSSQPGMQQTSSQPRGLERTIWRNFHDSETTSVAPVSVEDVRKAELSTKDKVGFVTRKAKRAARTALAHTAFGQAYEERYLQEKDQHQETSGLESPSYSRIGFPSPARVTDGHLKQENQLSTIGIGDTSENCFQTLLPEMKNDSIFTMGRKGKFEGADSIEFLFKQAEDMSKVVGVGLQWSKVVVTKQFGVVVQHIGEHFWSDLWKETSFSPMRIPIPKPPTKLSMFNLTPETSSKRFGVGLVGSKLENNRVYVEDNQNQTGEMFPFIFELAEKMGLSKNAKDSNFQHPSGISSEAVEGEKNDHGGPLLETMEGGGETDQGGTSSEPMDLMEVGESSQGGNSGEPMEGVVSGQGGPSSGPTEVGGQRDQQSSDFQLRFESLQAKGPQDSNENKSLTVIVIPEVGGTFYEGLSNRQVQPDCRIKGAAIAPWFKFKFEILGGERKITTTTETRCDLGGAQLTLHEDWDLGYCHDNITISLTCEDPQAVRVSPGIVVAMDVMKRAMTETFTGSMSRANQLASQANVQVQMPMVPIGIQAQGTLEVTDTIADSHALAVTVETSNTQFSGFNVNQLECSGSLVFNFLYPEEIVDVKGRGKRQFIHAGINKTLWPTIVGKWFPLDREEARLYIFKTNRDIHSIGSLMRFMHQRYEVPFVINHAMSHIHYYEDKELRGAGVKSVDRVLTKYPEV